MTKDKYKDPVYDKILKEISEKVKNMRYGIKVAGVDSIVIDYYRLGLYGGMNVVLRNLGREPL
jgi:hypothetical protein